MKYLAAYCLAALGGKSDVCNYKNILNELICLFFSKLFS